VVRYPEDYKLNVRGVVATLRGESPRAGVPAIVVDCGKEGNEVNFREIHKILQQGVGEVVTVIGKPFEQLNEISDFVKAFKGYVVMIETSGAVKKGTHRKLLIPIVDKATVIINPRRNLLSEDNYGWIRCYRFMDLFFKFTWQGSEDETHKVINTFFDIAGMSMYDQISNRRVLLMAGEVKDDEECRRVWDFCLGCKMRYSPREFVRLFKQEGKGNGKKTSRVK